jgi:hypothetical protein
LRLCGGFDMDAALDLAAGPAPGARVVGIGGDGRAGLAADAGIAEIVERQERDAEVLAQLPHVARGPVGKGVQLADDYAAGQREVGDLFKRGAAAGLLAAQSGEPDLVVCNGGEERFDLAQSAASIGGDLVQQAVFGLLLSDGARREQVDEIQLPLCGDAVAIGVGLGEMVAGVEEEDRDAGL